MTNRRYQEVQPRTTVQLFPPCLDDYVDADNPVRAIDAFVEYCRFRKEALGIGR